MRSIDKLAVLVAALGVLPGLPAHAAVTISSAATSNMSCTAGVCAPTAVHAVLNVGDLTSMLASGSVTVNTGTGSLPQQVEDIIVAATFNWASANSLTLDAYRSATVTAPVAVNGSAPVALVTNDGGSGGNLFFISGGSLSFLGTTNSLSINGSIYMLENSVATLAAAIAHKASGYYALSASYDASRDGTYGHAPVSQKFNGNFNGLGNSIANLSIKSGADYIGLFAYVKAGGAISSLVTTNSRVSAKAGSSAGVVVGINYGTVFNANAAGQVAGPLPAKAVSVFGGLVGNNHGLIVNSVSSATVAATSKSRPFGFGYLGGLAGLNDGTVQSSYATGLVSATGANNDVQLGGLTGFTQGSIENCYASGNAKSSGSPFAGGLAGLTYTSITDSYSTGAASGAGSNVGGFVGYDGSKGALSGDYWDTSTSGITNPGQGAGTPVNDPGITGETTAQLQAALPAGFDPTIWAENPSINNGLPYLIANPPQ
jgi:hypothetical protein